MKSSQNDAPEHDDGQSVSIRLRSWVRGCDDDIRSGLLGFVSVFYGALILDGITVRRTADGRLTLSYPQRRDSRGRGHPLIRPIDDDARLRIEKAIFEVATVSEGVTP